MCTVCMLGEAGGGSALCREPFSMEKPFAATEEVKLMLLDQGSGASAFQRQLTEEELLKSAFGGANAFVTSPLNSSRTHSSDADPWSKVSGAG